jgi:hypothetical protein
MTIAEAAALLGPLGMRLREVPTDPRVIAQTTRDLADLADDQPHAERIIRRLYLGGDFWPTPKQIRVAAEATRQRIAIDLPPVHCELCYDLGRYPEMDPLRPGFCMPGCPLVGCECGQEIIHA